MAKSRIGPFALEAPLSKLKNGGQLFRAIHLEQRKLAALRVFAIPMGMTPESREAFASQLEQLKQLRHPGVVRCYGGGFDTRSAFLAYELVDGESLQTMLKRRDRLPWETALDYALQLAEALQYAHQMGWVHGRLRPEKVLVSQEGHVKIQDFRRDAIASMLTTETHRRSHLQYAAPESLDSAADEKCDLYSLGGIMYTALTGHPPLDASDPDELCRAIRQDQPPPVSKSVLDCPVWLNAIVEQLLSKDPASRHFSATALQMALKEAQRRQSEGVGVLQHAASGFSPLQMKVDRNEAEKVLGIKPKKKKRKQSEESFFDNAWVLVVGFIVAIAAVVWFLLPLSEATLRARAEDLLASEKWIDWNDARDGYLDQLVERFPETPSAEWAAEKIDWVDARDAERRMDREERLGRNDDWTQAQIQYAEARSYERFGDLASAMDKFRAIVRLFRNEEEDAAIVYLASEAIERIGAEGVGTLSAFLESKLREAQKAYDDARIKDAKQILQSIIELYSNNQDVTGLVDRAQQQLDAINKA
ncbi:MAG: serine/threonine-protein kinase [Aureliella sp.]